MAPILLLLSPYWSSWKNDFVRAENRWGRRLSLLSLGLAFWLGTFFVIRRVLVYFQSVYDLGPALAYQLFLIIPASLGILITHLLVYCLPARRVRDILFFIGLISFIVLYFLFRFAQPE